MEFLEWLGAIHAYYGEPEPPFPFIVASEIWLHDQISNEMLAEAIVSRGIKVGNDIMSTTTPADVADAKQELIAIGFLADIFSLACDPTECSHGFYEGAIGCEEHVLEFRIPSNRRDMA